MIFKKLPPELKDLDQGLTRLKFTDNFQAFKVTLPIVAGETVEIENLFTPTPITEWTLLRIKNTESSGTVIIQEPLEPRWTSKKLYLQNAGTADAEVTVVFFT